jgi:hypothetical protein
MPGDIQEARPHNTTILGISVAGDAPRRGVNTNLGAGGLGVTRPNSTSAETVVRAHCYDDAKGYIQAKTRTEAVKDGLRLREVLGTLGLR